MLQLSDGRAELLDVLREALLTRDRRLRAHALLVRRAVERADDATRAPVEIMRERGGVFGDPPGQSIELVILRVDERRDPLEILHEPGLEVVERVELVAQERDDAGGGLLRFSRRGDVAVDVVDDVGVERLLPLDHRPHESPDEAVESLAPAAAKVRSVRPDELPSRVERGHLEVVEGRRRMRQVARGQERFVERAERLVVRAIGRFAPALELREVVLGDRASEHLWAGHDPPRTPSSGLDAVAYSLRGMRPAR